MSQIFRESLYNSYGQFFEISHVLFEEQSEFQHLIIFETPLFGRVMALDGIIQTTQKDEFIYHEMLCHVPLFAHPDPKRVLIVGGGDGGCLREVLKHNCLEQVTQVEIDQAVIDLCKEYLPEHSSGAFEHEKTNIVITDGLDYVKSCHQKFDVIISDSTDPQGPGEALFTTEFYQHAKHCLTPNGIIVTQNGVPFMQFDEVKTTQQRLGDLFDDQTFFLAGVPTYVGGQMTLAWATNDSSLREVTLETLNQRYLERDMSTRYYTPELHQAAFVLPRYIQESLLDKK